jgi:RNA polymerase sigma-70 factor (ECF subfamily)
VAASPEYEARAAVEELFREHRPNVYAICRSQLGDPGEAEDATQQVFLAAFRALANGTVPVRPGAWLAAIARNECHARAHARPPVATVDELAESPEADPSTQVVTRAEVSAVWAAIGELPPSQREALLLREVRGLSYDELADDLQLTRPSIRSLLARARHALRTRLGEGAAALGGVSWLDSLGRLLAGGSTPAAIATKTAAVGLGAAAITGGAIVAPELTPHPHRAAAIAQPRHVVVAHARPKPNPVQKAPPPVTHLVVARQPVVRHVRHHSQTPAIVVPRHEREHDVAVVDGGESRHDSGSSGDSSGPGPAAVAPAITSVPETAPTPLIELDSHDGGSDGSDGSDHAGGSDGSDGSGGSGPD